MTLRDDEHDRDLRAMRELTADLARIERERVAICLKYGIDPFLADEEALRALEGRETRPHPNALR